MVLAISCVLVGTLAAVTAVMAGWRTRNWIAYIFALGCAAFVAGVVGQRAFPSADAVRRLGAIAARTSTPGPFDAGITIPLVNLQITPVALGGVLIAALGLSLLLLFESAARPESGAESLKPLHDEDTV